MKRYLCLTCLAIAFCLPSCGGDSAGHTGLQSSQGPTPAVEATLPALPPAESYNPARVTAAFETTRLGAQAEQTSSNVTLASGYAQFDPLASQLCWAIYRFDGVPADQVTELAFTLSNVSSGSRAWFALSDYDRQGWSFIDSQNASAAVPLSFAPGQLTSASGQIYVAVLAYNGDSFRLLNLSLSFANRYQVSGQVVDENGAALPGALITTTLDEQGVLSDASGNFSLPTIPDGSWQIMASKDSYVFFANPQVVTVSGADVSGLQFTGYDNDSHFINFQGPEPNNFELDAADKGTATSFTDSISAIDDPVDLFLVSFDTPGNYILKCKAASGILFPEIQVRELTGYEAITSPWGMHGTVYVGFPIAEAPAQRLISVSCQGGGGTYTISFEPGQLAQLAGNIDNQGLGEIQAFTRIDISDSLDDSFTYAAYLSPAYYTLLPPNVYNVTPSDPDYSFNPVEATPNLAAGDQLAVDFEGTPVDINDMGEPNDDFATATTLSLPAQAAPGTLSIGGADLNDIYKVTPSAGKFLRAVLILRGATPTGGQDQVVIDIQDAAQNYVSGFCRRPDAWESRTTEPCTNDPYYIVVQCYFQRKFGYGLSIEEFDGTTIKVLAQIDGQPLEGTRIDNYILPLELREQQCRYTDENGETNLCLGVMQGETVYLEAFRYGMEFDRHTQLITAGAAPLNVEFNASSAQSLDFAEPNDSANPAMLAMPLDLTATTDHDTDEDDAYSVPSSGQMLKLSWDGLLAAGSCSLYIDAYDQDDIQITSVSGPQGVFIFPAGTSQTRLEVGNNGGDGRYNLKLEPVEAYYIQGQIIDDQPTEDGMASLRVQGHMADLEILSADEYRIGPLEPGEYTLECYAVNYDTSADSPALVTITNADVTQDFNLTSSYGDSSEPNDDKPSAVALADNTPLAANLDTNNPSQGDDYDDWYKFDTSGPGLVKVRAQLAAPWALIPSLEVLDNNDNVLWQTSVPGLNGSLEADLYLPSAGTYYVHLSFGDQDYVLTVNYP